MLKINSLTQRNNVNEGMTREGRRLSLDGNHIGKKEDLSSIEFAKKKRGKMKTEIYAETIDQMEVCGCRALKRKRKPTNHHTRAPDQKGRRTGRAINATKHI